MFEFIGVVAVACIIWFLGKSVVKGGIRGTLLRSVAYANESGVPTDYASGIIEYPDVIIKVRNELSRGDREFSSLKAHEQYGRVITHLYAKARKSEVDRLKKEIDGILRPQLEKLDNYSVCEVSSLYICVLASSLSKMMPTGSEVREIFDQCFSHPNLEIARNVAWDAMLSSANYKADVEAMGKIVSREIEAKKFDFFFRLRMKYIENYENGVNEHELAYLDPQ